MPTHPGLKEKSREKPDGAGPRSAVPWHSRSPTAPTPRSPELFQVPDEYPVGKEIQAVWIIHKNELEERMDSFLH